MLKIRKVNRADRELARILNFASSTTRNLSSRGARPSARAAVGDSKCNPCPNPPSDFDLRDPQQISKLLGYTANRVVRGELDPKCAYALGYLADCALRAHNAGAVTERFERLERLQEAEKEIPVDPPPDFFEDEDDGSTATDPSQVQSQMPFRQGRKYGSG